MKLTTNYAELKQLNACFSGRRAFRRVHGKTADVKLSDCFKSNDLIDVWWLVRRTIDQFSAEQRADLYLTAVIFIDAHLHGRPSYNGNPDLKQIVYWVAEWAKGGCTDQTLFNDARSLALGIGNNGFVRADMLSTVLLLTGHCISYLLPAMQAASRDHDPIEHDLKQLFLKWEESL